METIGPTKVYVLYFSSRQPRICRPYLSFQLQIIKNSKSKIQHSTPRHPKRASATPSTPYAPKPTHASTLKQPAGLSLPNEPPPNAPHKHTTDPPLLIRENCTPAAESKDHSPPPDYNSRTPPSSGHIPHDTPDPPHAPHNSPTS
jgi:hypothetical protein